MGINILPLIDEVLGDTLDARKVIRSQALLTCWTTASPFLLLTTNQASLSEIFEVLSGRAAQGPWAGLQLQLILCSLFLRGNSKGF